MVVDDVIQISFPALRKDMSQLLDDGLCVGSSSFLIHVAAVFEITPVVVESAVCVVADEWQIIPSAQFLDGS